MMRRLKRLVVKLSADEQAAILRLAASERLPPATMARRLLLHAAEARTVCQARDGRGGLTQP